MTIPQQCDQEFELLAEKVIAKLLEGTNAKVCRTDKYKDGGYDIVAYCFDGSTTRKVYFECKLRNKNLNLRDIAANVIIAFNEGAIGLVALTNCDYTPQADKHIGQFYQKTILNIKIIIGAEIKRIVLENRMPISDELFSILKESKSLRTETTSFLRLDYTKGNIHAQIFQKNPSQNQSTETFLSTLLSHELETTARQLQQGCTVLVAGYAGVGKSTYISSALSKCPDHQVHLDGLLYTTQEQLLLDLAVQIWGIPEQLLIADLDETHLNAISSRIGGNDNDPETTQIIRSIIDTSNTAPSHSIQYNCLVCRYLLSLLNIHKTNIRYIFYLENLQFCKPEIFQLLLYLVKLLADDEIGCVIEYKQGEYKSQQENLFLPEISHLRNYVPVKINILNPSQALDYLAYAKPDLPESTAQTILSLVGCRLYNLTLILNYLEQRMVDFCNPQQIASELNALTPNDIPNIISKTFPFYRQKHRALFDLLSLLHGSAPLEFLPLIGVRTEEIDSLIDEQIVFYKSGHIVPANEFVLQEILHGVYPLRPSHVRIAECLLAFTTQRPKQYQSAQIYMLYHTEQYDRALGLLSAYIDQLKQERQYSALIDFLDIAIDISQKMKSYEKYASFLVQQLDVMVLKKDIVGSKAGERISELSQVLSSCRLKVDAKVFQMAHDYFHGKRVFKQGRLNSNEPAFQANKQHYEDCVSGRYLNNAGDWLGRVCCNYAMFVKEMQGNAQALSVFQSALGAIPDSFELLREYYSHEACIRLFDAPEEAYMFYQKVLEMFERQPNRCALPFHERGDIAMSLLLSGKFDEAIGAAEESVELADSYGVWDEVGRIFNIEGCACLCAGDEQRAERLFVKSTALMERSGYKLYCWRSRLNELQMKLCTDKDKQRLQLFLQKTYEDFEALLKNKIREMISQPRDDFVKSREYHALLVFGKCSRLMNVPMEEKIIDELGIEAISDTYYGHIEELIKRPNHCVIAGSPYFHNGKIMMVG